ncbi:nucleoside hydrolase [Pseudoclavibacter sp. 13-3]|uniref:nucleoside hydrolase n=1 Tax=Pseudoclavibacter sp. 13-3 TaxID=2901228 RepID=UPI001E342CE6|nr:nucleoside hydrolase [Pseudoclavibacter sp. 13-3]MCD7100748.1 nucleoside hydrolase [Pseudoclavibacter sp. 13-3]
MFELPTPRTLPIFVDCDPGIDDAIALGYLLCQSDVDITGIAASAGNVSTDLVLRNVLGWLELAGRGDIPVHRGADRPIAWPTAEHSPEPDYADDTHGASGAGYAQLPEPSFAASAVPAADAWVAAAREHPGELVGVVIGPATNLALALRIEPELPHLIKRLFIMGGAFNYRGNTWPTTEWNVTFDPESTAEVLAAFGTAAHLPVIAPIEATESVVMTPERLERLLTPGQADAAAAPASPTASLAADTASAPAAAREPSPAAASPAWNSWLVQLGEALRFYFEFHEADGHGYLAHIHDPYVMAAAIEWARRHRGSSAAHRGCTDTARAQALALGAPEHGIPWAQTKTAAVDVELTGTLTRGETVADWLGRWNRPVNAELIRSIDAEPFLDHLITTLKKGPARS